MSIKAGLYSFLTGSTPIAAVVGTRVYPMLVPQGAAYPAITYQIVSNNHIRSHGGSSQLAYVRVQINSWAATAAAADSLQELIRNRMDGYAGTMGSVTVQSCFLDGERDAFEPSPGDEADRIYGYRQDFTIAYTESDPTFA